MGTWLGETNLPDVWAGQGQTNQKSEPKNNKPEKKKN